MLASLKAKVLAVKAYVVAHYKQLLAAVLAGHYGVIPAASKLVVGAGAAVAHLVSRL